MAVETTERSVALDMLANIADFPAQEIIYVLTEADDLYHNDEESFIEDNEYDALYQVAKRLDPANVYFTGVGSDVRGGKIDLPFEMGSLNQVEIGDITDWVGNWSLQNESVVITDKMDGTSAMIVYDKDGQPQIAYSRGNGVQGADISRHIFKIKNVPDQVSGKLTVRAEVELTETAFEFLRDKVTRHSSNEPYKNARNMVAGLMNRKENPAIVYEHLTVVTYEVIGHEGSKAEQLMLLEDNGFDIVSWCIAAGYELTDEFLADYLNNRREDLDYAIDGLVIDVDSETKRASMNPTRDTLNPEYSIKYKVADADNTAIATVKGVTWNVSKHGYLKPQVNLVPFELCGVTISNATGFNAKFILENAIGAGAKVRMTRSGDVIPFIQEVVLGAKNMMGGMPDNMDDCYWTVNVLGENVDLVLKESTDEVEINQMIDFFMKIEAPFLKEGNVRKLYTAGYTKPEHVIRDLDVRSAVSILGENGKKIVAGVKDKLTNIPAYRLLGAFSTERGMGVRKFKKLQKAFGLNAIVNGQVFAKQIVGVEGFEEKSAKKAEQVMRDLGTFLSYIDGTYTWEVEQDTSGGDLVGQKICMTGFRDKDMAAAIEAAGGEVQSGVSGKTTLLVCKDPTSNSGKVKKAKDKGVKVISIDEMKGML